MGKILIEKTAEAQIPDSSDLHINKDTMVLNLKSDRAEQTSLTMLERLWGKRLLGIKGDSLNIGKFTSIGNTTYFCNGFYEIGSIMNGRLKLQSIENIILNAGLIIKKPQNKEILDLGSDGRVLYCLTGIGQVFVLDSNMNYRSNFLAKDAIRGDFLSGNNCAFISIGEYSWNEYSRGQFVRLRKLSDGLVDDRVAFMLKFMENMGKNEKPDNADYWKEREEKKEWDFFSLGFTDGFSPYGLSSKGTLWYIGPGNSRKILQLEYHEDEEPEILFTHNGLEAAIVQGNQINIVSGGKHIAHALIKPKVKLESVQMDQEYVYISTGNVLQRYRLIR